MPFKQTTPMQTVQNYLHEQIEKRNDILVRITFYTGESGLRIARLWGNYIDRTGNLRSSTGYVVIRNGEVLNTIINESDKGTDRKTGVKAGEEFLKELAKKFNKGIALVMAAGMKYSGRVSARGYDVLDSSVGEVEWVFLRLLKQNGFIAK